MNNWRIGFFGEDIRPSATYQCPACHTVTYFDLVGDGAVPDPKCCIAREPFPLDLYDHLRKKLKRAPVPTEAITDFSRDSFVVAAMRRLHNFVTVR
jgi:hypothetical protein